MIRSLIHKLGQLPPLQGDCLFCHQTTAQPLLCDFCAESLPLLDHHCRLCGRPLAGHRLTCDTCTQQPPVWDYLHILADYEFPLPGLIHQLKYQRDPLPAALLGQLLAHTYPDDEPQPEVLLPVPLHWWREWQRGFNQSKELARAINKLLHIPYNDRILERTRATQVQAGLTREERQTNLTQAFQIHAHPFRHVALIDDVVTTGTTAATLVELLKRSGCTRVDVWAICRTQVHSGDCP
jgi:ComF family protein